MCLGVAHVLAAEDAGADADADSEDLVEEGCGESFTAGTKALLASGAAIPISQLKSGDKVLATNTKTGKTSPETVTAVMVKRDTNRYDPTIRTRHRTAVIGTTRNHLFWDLTRHQWVKAGALRYGDHLRAANGASVTVIGGRTPADAVGWMWDLTIPGDHDFYIDTAAALVLVHNCTGTRRPGTTPEKPTTPPSWVKNEGHYAETTDPNPASAASRIMNERYPDGWSGTGGGSEYSQLMKWLSRYFIWS